MVGQASPQSSSNRSSAAFVTSGAIGLVVTALAMTAWPDLARVHATAYGISGAAMTLSDLMLLVAVLALWRNPVAGSGRLRAVGIVLAAVASTGVVVAEMALRVDHPVGNTLFTIVGPVQALGLILIGVAVVRARVVGGVRRWSLLATGAYVPLVLGPALAASGGENLPALGGFHALVVLTGLSLVVPRVRTVSQAAPSARARNSRSSATYSAGHS